MSILLIESIYLVFDCIEEISLPGLEGGCGASEDLILSLLPNLLSRN
jgi:hypothetical protein